MISKKWWLNMIDNDHIFHFYKWLMKNKRSLIMNCWLRSPLGVKKKLFIFSLQSFLQLVERKLHLWSLTCDLFSKLVHNFALEAFNVIPRVILMNRNRSQVFIINVVYHCEGDSKHTKQKKFKENYASPKYLDQVFSNPYSRPLPHPTPHHIITIHFNPPPSDMPS